MVQGFQAKNLSVGRVRNVLIIGTCLLEELIPMQTMEQPEPTKVVIFMKDNPTIDATKGWLCCGHQLLNGPIP
jgi:hypothetical protein